MLRLDTFQYKRVNCKIKYYIAIMVQNDHQLYEFQRKGWKRVYTFSAVDPYEFKENA